MNRRQYIAAIVGLVAIGGLVAVNLAGDDTVTAVGERETAPVEPSAEPEEEAPAPTTTAPVVEAPSGSIGSARAPTTNSTPRSLS